MNGINPPVPTEEDEEWERLEHEIQKKLGQLVMQQSIECAQEFIEGLTPAELGIFTLRKAFESGYRAGAGWVHKRIGCS